MNASQMREVRQAAARRVEQRRRPPVDRVLHHRGVAGADLLVAEVQGSIYLEPATLGEWIDLAEVTFAQWRGPFSEITVAALEAGRASEQAAAAEIRRARRLGPHEQYRLSADLDAIRARATLPGARSLVRALTAAAEDAGLQDTAPGHPEHELPDPPGPPVIRYPTRLGTPAGRLPWLDGPAA